jgi:hypothetical protein
VVAEQRSIRLGWGVGHLCRGGARRFSAAAHLGSSSSPVSTSLLRRWRSQARKILEAGRGEKRGMKRAGEWVRVSGLAGDRGNGMSTRSHAPLLRSRAGMVRTDARARGLGHSHGLSSPFASIYLLSHSNLSFEF